MTDTMVDTVQTPTLNASVASNDADWPTRRRLIGVDVSAVEYDEAVDCILSAASNRRRGIVSCHAVHAVVTASCDPELRDAVNQFSMVTPDGQPVRWALNWLHRTGLKERVYGPELMLRVCRAAAERKVSIYLYGGTPEILEKLQANLSRSAPGLIIAGSESPPFRVLSEEENAAACERINQSGAGILLIGLGCPKQDWFAAKNASQIKAVQMCVGAAFDFHAGVKPMAPQWMQRRGLEWLFRLVSEPRRLWKRYLVTNSLFCVKVAGDFFRRVWSAKPA